MRPSHWLPICSALLFTIPAQAQRHRCVDSNGFGYECSGSTARAAEQSAWSSPKPQSQISINLNKLGTSQWEDTSKKPPPSYHEGSSSTAPIQHKTDPLDAWPSATRSHPGR